MPNINAVVNEQIRRLARREIRANTKTIKKATGHYRRDIAALKRQVAQLTKQVAAVKKQMPDQPQLPPAEAVQGARLRVSGLKSHRARLGLSAKDYGSLMGVSGLTIYNWEAGKSKPRRSLLPQIVAVRGIGKKEAMQRLGIGKKTEPTKTASAVKAKTQKPGKSKQTAADLILSLLKGRKALTSTEINVAWKKAGRAGNADNTLPLMTKARKIKRTKLKGQRGSEYRVG